MNKSELNILIVDDEPSVLSSLGEVFKRAGYNAILTGKPAEAESIAKIKPIHACIIDCMLPGKNGVDLAEVLRERMGEKAPVYFISGIFKDPGYAQDAMSRVNAREFYHKPVDGAEILKDIESVLIELVSAPKVDMHALLASPFSDNRERRKAIDLVEDMTGYDIPFMCCILMDAESSGHLNLVSEDQDIYGVSFVKGEIAKVDSEDTKKTLRDLVIRKGFVTEEEVSQVEKEKKGNIIKNLISESYLSPHVLSIIQPEQMVYDLNNMISDKKMQVNFVPDRRLKAEGATINMQAFNPQLHDMLNDIPLEWFKDFYLTWDGHPTLEGPQIDSNHQILKMPILEAAKGLFDKLKSTPTIAEAQQYLNIDELAFYKALHLLMIRRLFVFDEHKKAMNVEDHVARINKIYNALKGKTPPEIFAYFGAAEDAKPQDCSRIYKEFVKSNHPDKLPPNISDDVKKLNHELFAIVSDANDIMSNAEKKSKYFEKQRQETAQKQMQSEDISQKAMIMLQRGKASEALKLIEEAKELYEGPQTQLLYMWAIMKSKPNISPQELAKYEANLKNIPIDSRKDAIYPFVNGLRKKLALDFEGAHKEFTKSLQVDNQFMDARREIASLKGAKKKDLSAKDLLTGDLTDIVGNLFKKKKSR